MKTINMKNLAAKRKQLEAEVELLESVIDEAVHWDRPSEISAAIARIRMLADAVAKEAGVPLGK